VLFRLGRFEIDSGRYELRRDGEPVPLEPKVLDLVLHLVRERHRLVTKQELLDEVWRGVHVSESTLTRAVSLARAALGDTGQEQAVIETVAGRGYRWKAPVEALAAEPARGGAPSAPVAATPRGRLGRLAAALGAAALAVIAGAALSWPRPLGWALQWSGVGSPPESPALPAEPSVVVLPFRDLGPSGDHAHLAEGISEDLTSELIRFPTLFVISSRSAATYRDGSTPLEEIARELGVRYVVEGTVRSTDDQLVVTSRLVDARSGVSVFGDRFESELGDALDVQGRLAEQIVGALGAEIEDAELKRLRRRETSDFGAYELFLQARSDFYVYTRESHARALAGLDRAIALDPDYAPALAYRGALETASFLLGWDPRSERLAAARAWLQRSLEADPSSALPFAGLAMVETAEERREAALASARRAVERGPNSDVCHGMLAVTLFDNRRPLEAVRALDRAFRLNPRHPELYWLLGGFLQARAGRSEAAAELFERVREANPDIVPPRLALLAQRMADGDLERARELAREIQTINPALDAEGALRVYPSPLRTPEILASFRAAGLR
jgi:TolB-like protein/DNA-binding winged helix-turn-helix (wHTH) protein